jgi:hemolysin activation/secretion protein
MTFISRNCPLALSAITLALCALSVSSWAQSAAAPDAGQVLRGLQQSPAAPAPQAPPVLETQNQPTKAQAGESSMLVQSISISGNQELPTSALQPLLSDLIGTQQTLSQLNAAAGRITAYYRSRGFAVARAYLPAQEISNGAVSVSVIEGRIDSYRVNNQSRLSGQRAQAYFSTIQSGDVIKSAQIDRSLLLLQDTPGVGGSRATLQPGASVGTSELLVEVLPGAAYSGSVALDNYGNRYTGEYRLSGTLNINSPLQMGDQLTLSGLSSGERLSFARLAYQLPLGSQGLRVGAAYFDTRYKLGQEFASLQAHGSASSTSVFASYPLVRSPLKNLSATAALENKRLNDQIDSTATDTGKTVRVASLGLVGSVQDSLGGGGINSAELSVVSGHLSINSASALAIDAASAQTHGGYSRLSYSLSRLQRIGASEQILLSVTSQNASKNLDSSEKFSLGGANGVRAYPLGEASGDEGYRATLELRHQVLPLVQASVFYDIGSVSINKTPFGPTANNRRTLSAVGVGLNASIRRVQLKASLAWRASSEQANSIPASAIHAPMLWVQAAVPF